MSSFQGVGIEVFHCIQRCPHFRGLGSTVHRGVLISGGWNREVPLYTEVSSFQGVGIEVFHCIALITLHHRRIILEEEFVQEPVYKCTQAGVGQSCDTQTPQS